QGPQINAIGLKAEGQGVAQGGEIGAPMAVDGSLWVTCRSRRVEEAQGLPLIFGLRDGERGVALAEQDLIADAADRWNRLTWHIDVDDQDGMVDKAQGLLREERVLAIEEQNFGGAMVERESDGVRI